MKRQARVWYKTEEAGLLEELADRYRFTYLPSYAAKEGAQPISLSLPLGMPAVETPQLHPVFDGLIPEGWLLDVAQRTWKLNPRDRMGVLLVVCRDCVGAIGIEDITQKEEDI